MFTCGTSNSTISSKTLALIDRAKKLSSRPTCNSTSPTILTRSDLSETGPPSNSPSPTLTPNLTDALRRIAELEEGASKSANLLTFALDSIAKLGKQVTRCSSTPNSLLTPALSPCTLKRRPTCTKGADCKFGHSAEDSTTTSDSEDSLASCRLAPPTPRRSKRRPPTYRPQVMASSVPYSTSIPSVPCSSVLLPRSVHDISHTGLQEEHVLASIPASQRSRADYVGEDEVAAAAVLKTIVNKVVEDEQKQHIAALATKAGDLEVKYKERNQPDMDEEGVTRSPDLPQVVVNFAKVNPFALGKLPRPELLPRLGCSEDADLYVKCITHLSSEDCSKKPENCKSKFSDSGKSYAHKVESTRNKALWKSITSWCFGARAGFVTDLGVIPPPSEPVHGYVYSGGTGDNTRYVLHAEAA